MAYPNCMFDVEEERLFGIEHKNASMLWYRQRNYDNGCKTTAACPDCPKGCYPYDTVASKQSIVSRMAAVLATLGRANASEGWADFLLAAPDRFGNRVAWNRTVVAGHSRGSACQDLDIVTPLGHLIGHLIGHFTSHSYTTVRQRRVLG